MPENTEIITTPERLNEVVDQLVTAPRVALDVESDGFYSYSDRVCIVTLSSESLNVVVDTLALEAAPSLARLTERTDTPLLLHSGQNDVLALKRDCNLRFGFVQDTAVAALLLDLPHTGLAALAEGYLGLSLEKELQRHDWSRRPIEHEHVRYLINDTRHLFPLHDLLMEEIKQRGLVDEYEIECRAVAYAEPKEREFDPERFRRIKGHGELTDQQRGVLKALYAWRNALAQQLGRAPFRIVGDHTLLAIARALPDSSKPLSEVRGVGEWLIEEFAEAILEHVRSAAPASIWPPRKPAEEDTVRLDPRQRDMLGRLKRWRENEKTARGVGLQAVLPTVALKELIAKPPRTVQELADHPRVGKARAVRYGEELLRIFGVRAG